VIPLDVNKVILSGLANPEPYCLEGSCPIPRWSLTGPGNKDRSEVFKNSDLIVIKSGWQGFEALRTVASSQTRAADTGATLHPKLTFHSYESSLILDPLWGSQ